MQHVHCRPEKNLLVAVLVRAVADYKLKELNIYHTDRKYAARIKARIKVEAEKWLFAEGVEDEVFSVEWIMRELGFKNWRKYRTQLIDYIADNYDNVIVCYEAPYTLTGLYRRASSYAHETLLVATSGK